MIFEGKRLGVHPPNGITGFSLHFPKELSYGYLWFAVNGKILSIALHCKCLQENRSAGISKIFQICGGVMTFTALESS